MLPGITMICCCCWFDILWMGLLRGVGLTVERTFLFNGLVDIPGSILMKSTTISCYLNLNPSFSILVVLERLCTP